MTKLGMTPWVDKAFYGAWERIAQEVPPSWMPREIATPHLAHRGKTAILEEFACGHYGCVLPTNEPGLVVKVTTDVTEATFVSMLPVMGQPDRGIVKYFEIFKIAGVKHRNRQLYVLWRSEAFEVGFLTQMSPGYGNKNLDYDEHDMRELNKGKKLLGDFLDNAGLARVKMQRLLDKTSGDDRARVLADVWHEYETVDMELSPDYGPVERKIGILLRKCLLIAQEMSSTHIIDPIGFALAYFLEEGVLLADVHYGNIGRVPDEDYSHPQLIITDPGHAMPFQSRWAVPPTIRSI